MSKKTFFSNALILVMISIASLSAADTILVPADYPTIQEAIDAASNGDQITVSPGTYLEWIEFKGKNIILTSEDPTSPPLVEKTIIKWNDYNSDHPIVTFSGTETEECILNGFTITHGSNYYRDGGVMGYGTGATIMNNHIIKNGGSAVHGGYGGGIRACNGLIKSNVISENTAQYKGGALHDCNGLIENNIISDNEANFGGGIGFCNGVIRNNEISNNYAVHNGGGLTNCHGVIEDNIIRNNYAKNGGGLEVCNGLILDNEFIGNRAYEDGGGIQNCHGIVRGNIFSGNTSNMFGGAASGCSSLFRDNDFMNNDANWGGVLSRCTGDVINNEFKVNSARHGGAIHNCNGLIAFNRFSDNISRDSGGCFFEMTEGSVENNVIEWNKSKIEGGVFANCYSIIRNNMIAYNMSEKNGGVFYLCGGEIQNNIIYENIGQFGGAFAECGGNIWNNVVYYNAATAGGGFYRCDADIQNCIVWANSALLHDQLYLTEDVRYSCIQDGNSENGNISIDPLFVNETENDFHLQAGSPCIDAGNPELAYNDALRPPGLGSFLNDMGAYGGPYNNGWLKGVPVGALAELSPGGALHIAENQGAPPLTDPELLGMTGFSFQPEKGWLPQDGDFNSDGFDDLVQITEYGDAWVYTQPNTLYSPTRWGWLGYSYRETVSDNGDIPIVGDVDGDGDDDLIQVTGYTDAWVALSSETSYDNPVRWGWLGFRFKRGDETTKGELPLVADTNGDGMDDLIQVTEYGDAWVALSSETMYDSPTRWGWLGFSYQPAAAWFPMTGDFNGDGMDDLLQITPFGDPWVALSNRSSFMTPTRWGWLDFTYYEPSGSYPITVDVNLDGQTDLIQIRSDGSVWVAFSKGNSFDVPEYWGNPGFGFSRNDGRLPFYLNY